MTVLGTWGIAPVTPATPAVPTTGQTSVGSPVLNFTGPVGVAMNLFSQLPALQSPSGQVFYGNITAGSLPPGISFVGGYFIGTPTTAGNYSVTISQDVLFIQYNFTVTPGSTPTPATVSVTLISWWTAWAAARNGYKIRRAIWVNKYLEFATYTWWLQTFDATTLAMISRTVVTAMDLVIADFRAADWTLDGIPGQATTGTAATTSGPDAPALNQGNVSGDLYIGTAARLVPLSNGVVLQLKNSSGQWVDEESHTAP